jgi:hypothetical protein
MALKGRRFQTVEDVIMNTTNELTVIPETSFEQ